MGLEQETKEIMGWGRARGARWSSSPSPAAPPLASFLSGRLHSFSRLTESSPKAHEHEAPNQLGLEQALGFRVKRQ